MARRSSGKSSKASRKKSPSKPKAQKQANAKRADAPPMRHRKDPEETAPREHMLDDGSKRDIGAVVLIILAVILFLLALFPSDALVSGAGSLAIHLTLGIGSYVLPFILLVIAILVFWRKDDRKGIGRVAVGCAIVFVSLLAVFSLFAPITVLGVDDPDLLFQEQSLASYGGYVGAALVWSGLVLFGRPITVVIVIGLMLIGCIVIGLSISSIIERMRVRAQAIPRPSIHLSGARRLADGIARRRDDDADEPPYEDGYEEDPFDPDMTMVLGTDGPNRRKDVEWDTDDAAMTVRLVERASSRSASQRTDDEPFPEYDDVAYGEGDDVTDGIEGFEDFPDASAETIAFDAPWNSASEDGNAIETASIETSSNDRDPAPAVEPSGSFVLPSPRLLNKPGRRSKSSRSDLEATASSLQQVLHEFGIDAKVVEWIAGPTVTLFEVDLPPGIRVSRVTALSDDIALALASPGVRIFAPVPGTNYVGIEVPNAKRETVLLSEVLDDAPEGPLQIAIGKDVEGNSIVSDLAKMPHLLIGGTTGSGKSVSINGMIMSILMRATPDEVRFIMIDPKRVEFTPYNGIPHLYVPVVTEASEAASALAWGVAEMERRLKVFSKLGVRNISQYNSLVDAQPPEGEDPSGEEVDGPEERLESMPYLVIIIDELADLMMNVGKEVEISISRIAQLARAAGIHLIVATQRPSTNVVTGLIKSNITNRIAFNVASGIDSRVILDTTGAESLIGLGDLLLSKPELAKPQRIQGCFVTEEEIAKVVDHVKSQGEPEYHGEILSTNVVTLGASSPQGGSGGGDADPLVWEAAEIVSSSGFGSTSNIQRRLKVGYARAGRIMDQLEEMGIVGPANGSKPREVLVDELELESIKAFETSQD